MNLGEHTGVSMFSLFFASPAGNPVNLTSFVSLAFISIFWRYGLSRQVTLTAALLNENPKPGLIFCACVAFFDKPLHAPRFMGEYQVYLLDFLDTIAGSCYCCIRTQQ